VIKPAEQHILLASRHLSRTAYGDIDLNQNRIRTPKQMMDPRPLQGERPVRLLDPEHSGSADPPLPLDKAPLAG